MAGETIQAPAPRILFQAPHIWQNYIQPQPDWASGKYFKQTADIGVSGTWTPIGNSTTPFRGNYDGQGYSISGVAVNNLSTSTYWGFFGMTNGANIQNLGVINVNIAWKSQCGGLIGYAQSTTVNSCYTTGSVGAYYDMSGGLIGIVNGCTITNCYSTATVSAGGSGSGSYSGGLIARTDNTGSNISNCYHTTGDVSGKDYVGGVIGALMHGTISYCYSTGLVKGTSETGGLVGKNDATINNCYSHAVSNCGNVSGGFVGTNTGTITNSYSTGNPGATTNEGGFAGQNTNTITNCFWDKTTSDITTSAGGTGKTTEEMKTLSTFTDTGTEGLSSAWDFVANPNDDAANDNYWDMDLSGSNNSGYPYLYWEDGDDVSLPVTLTSFTGKAIKAGVLLVWETSAEIENAGFVIYRSEEEDTALNPSLASGQAHLIEGTSENPLSRGVAEGRGVLLASYLDHQSLVGAGSVTKSTRYSYTDTQVKAGETYTYILSDVDFSGKETIQAEVTLRLRPGSAIIADNYTLMPVYPNPFNASFTVPFTLNETMNVKLTLYNIAGQRVMEILNTELSAGDYHYQINADDLGSGVYFLNLDLASSKYSAKHTQKIVLMK